MNMDVKKLYDNRFKKKEIDRKHAIWDPLVIVGSDFFFAVVSNTLPKEGGYVIRFYCVYGCTDNLVVKGL